MKASRGEPTFPFRFAAAERDEKDATFAAVVVVVVIIVAALSRTVVVIVTLGVFVAVDRVSGIHIRHCLYMLSPFRICLPAFPREDASRL